MANLDTLTEEAIKEKAYIVRLAIYEEMSYPPPIKLSTEMITRAVHKITRIQPFIQVVSKSDMDELRGALFTFPTCELFRAYIEKHNVRDEGINQLDDSSGVGLILLSDENNECWKRFTVVKESMHLVLEAEDIMEDTNVSELSKAVVRSASYSTGGDTQKVLKNREDAGVLAAIEILLPDSLKGWLAHKANVEKYTPFQIAHRIKVPEKFVEQRMEEWGIDINP